MDWKSEFERRKQQKEPLQRKKDKLYKEINKIDKEIKKIGTTDYAEFFKEFITKSGYPCVVKRFKGDIESFWIDIYSKNATKKQIQCRRQELVIGSICITEVNGVCYQDKYIKDSPEPYSDYLYDLPDNIEDVIQLIIK